MQHSLRNGPSRGLGTKLKLLVATWLRSRLIIALLKLLVPLNLPDLPVGPNHPHQPLYFRSVSWEIHAILILICAEIYAMFKPVGYQTSYRYGLRRVQKWPQKRSQNIKFEKLSLGGMPPKDLLSCCILTHAVTYSAGPIQFRFHWA